MHENYRKLGKIKENNAKVLPTEAQRNTEKR